MRACARDDDDADDDAFCENMAQVCGGCLVL